MTYTQMLANKDFVSRHWSYDQGRFDLVWPKHFSNSGTEPSLLKLQLDRDNSFLLNNAFII